MKNRYMSFGFLFAVSVLLFAGCSRDGERKIKLADQPVTALKLKQVETIEIAADQKKKVALVDFENRAEPGAAWLSAGIKEKLSRELAQSRQLNLNPSRFVNDVIDTLGLTVLDLNNERFGAQLARKINADVLIRGDYYFKNDLLHLDVELRRNDGSLLVQYSRTGSHADTLAALNTLVSLMAIDIRGQLEVHPKGPAEVETLHATASTTSKEALNLYIEGREKLDQFYMDEAIPLFARAIELDTTFASAYTGLARGLMALGNYSQVRPVLEKAMQHARHLSDRERIPIEANYAMINGQYYKALELYNHLLDLYPEDYDVHYEVGQYYFSIAHNYHKAIEKFETVLELYPKHKMAHNQLAYAYAHVGELDHALYILEKYAELAPDEPNPYDSYGELLMGEGRLHESIKMFKKALDINPDFWHSQVHLATAYRDLGRTRKAYSILTAIETDSVYKKHRKVLTQQLALNAIISNDMNAAVNYFEKAVQEEPKDLGYHLSLLYLRPDDHNYRAWFVDELKRQDTLAQKDSLEYGLLLGLVSQSLNHNLGVDVVDHLLDSALNGTTDPILYQAAIAYKLILDFRFGRNTAATERLYAQADDPETFQYAQPATWDDYWRHYFDALQIAAQHGVPVVEWAKGFYEFAKASGNQHFEINGAIAVAASDYFSGNTQAAKQKMQDVGIPCESAWSFVGPFDMHKGFHHKFWPEKVDAEKWTSTDNYAAAIFQKRDDLFDGYVNIKQITNFKTNQAVYAFLEMNSKDYKQVQLRFGNSGRLKVWLNGEPVMIKNIRGDAIIDRYIANAKLHLGTNHMLVRIDNAIGELGFYFRVTDMDGRGDPDIDFKMPMMANLANEEKNLN